ncbi:MAG: phage tail protein, partial [Rhodospirillales bacterium]
PGLTARTLGQRGGTENETLTIQQMPSHKHDVTAMAQSGNGDSAAPGGNVWAKKPRDNDYSTAAPNVTMSAAAISETAVGGSQPHNNMPPFLALNYIIALQGTFPSRN